MDRMTRLPSRRRVGIVLLLAAILALRPPPTASAAPASNDAGFKFEWGLSMIHAPEAWNVTRGKGSTIAVVDTGVSLSHQDLQGGKIVGAETCLGTGGNSAACRPGGQDDDGHGTHVSGIAAANADNGVGIAGVAPQAKILAVKVLSESCGIDGCTGSGSSDDVSAGIVWAADHGATVINLSLGSDTQFVLGPAFSQAIEYAWAKGVVPVVAAGNTFVLGSGFNNEPAIVVSAVNRSGAKASYSNGVGGAKWSIAAPGGEPDDDLSCSTAPLGVLSTFWESGNASAYACLAGTSMAAPHVAGAAALLRAAGLSAQQTVDRLLSTATDLGLPGRDSTYGSGLLNLAAATKGLGGTTSTTGGSSTSTSGTTPTTIKGSGGSTTSRPGATRSGAGGSSGTTDATGRRQQGAAPTVDLGGTGERAGGATTSARYSEGGTGGLGVVAGLLAGGVGLSALLVVRRRRSAPG